MRFKRRLIPEDPKQFSLLAFANVFFIIFVFFMMPPAISEKSGAKIDLAKVITSDIVQDERLVITIAKEDSIYLDSKKVRLEDLENILAPKLQKNASVLIKVDRSVALEKISDIVNLCQDLGLNQVNIVTVKE